MVMRGGNSPDEVTAAVAQMAGTYRVRTRMHLLDLDHNFIADLSDLQVSSGAVTVQADQPITRSMSLQLVDRSDVLRLAGTASSPTFLVQAWKGIYVDTLGEWIDFPVICAYVTKPSRSGDLLSIEGQDKGALGLFPTRSMVFKKGTNIGSAIRDVMQLRAGERRFRLSATKAKLPRDYVLDDQTTPLALARAMGAEISWKVFYDAEGYLVGRPSSTSPVFTFRSGIGGTLTSPVETGYWDRDIYNRVVLTGPVVSGKQVTGEAVLPVTHPLSPENLERGSVLESGRRTYRATSNSVTSREVAKDWCEQKLRSLSLQQQTATFSSVPIWHLQEYDVVRAIDPLDGIDTSVRWTEASIPMSSDGTQSNGYTKRNGPSFKHARRSSSVRRTKKK